METIYLNKGQGILSQINLMRKTGSKTKWKAEEPTTQF